MPAKKDIVRPVSLSEIREGRMTQSRAELRQEEVEKYAADMERGDKFPAITLVEDEDGSYWIADGHHRVRAAHIAGYAEIDAVVLEGTQRDALRMSLTANMKHGIRRSNRDKRYSILVALKDLEWSQKSSRQIAEWLDVSHQLVNQMRQEMVGLRKKPEPEPEDELEEKVDPLLDVEDEEEDDGTTPEPAPYMTSRAPVKDNGPEDMQRQQDRLDEVRARMKDWVVQANNLLRDMKDCSGQDIHWDRVAENARAAFVKGVKTIKMWAPIGACVHCENQEGCKFCAFTGLMTAQQKKDFEAVDIRTTPKPKKVEDEFEEF